MFFFILKPRHRQLLLFRVVIVPIRTPVQDPAVKPLAMALERKIAIRKVSAVGRFRDQGSPPTPVAGGARTCCNATRDLEESSFPCSPDKCRAWSSTRPCPSGASSCSCRLCGFPLFLPFLTSHFRSLKKRYLVLVRESISVALRTDEDEHLLAREIRNLLESQGPDATRRRRAPVHRLCTIRKRLLWQHPSVRIGTIRSKTHSLTPFKGSLLFDYFYNVPPTN